MIDTCGVVSGLWLLHRAGEGGSISISSLSNGMRSIGGRSVSSRLNFVVSSESVSTSCTVCGAGKERILTPLFPV